MGINQANLHPKVLKNQLFIRAVDWLIDNKKVASQKELAALTKIQEPTISNIRNDKKVVSDPTIRKLLESFPGLFNPDFFRGQSVYMTIKEMIEADIDKETNYPHPKTNIDEGIPSLSSVFNSALAKADQTIEALKIALQRADEMLAEKDARIKEKDERIAELKAHNVDLRRQLNQYQGSDIDRYPFPIGAAETNNPKPLRQ